MGFHVIVEGMGNAKPEKQNYTLRLFVSIVMQISMKSGRIFF